MKAAAGSAKLFSSNLWNNQIELLSNLHATLHPCPSRTSLHPFDALKHIPFSPPLNVLFVFSNLFSWGRINFATLIHDSTHARLVFRICALNSGQSCLSCPMWINISRKLATWVLISINICKIVCLCVNKSVLSIINYHGGG